MKLTCIFILSIFFVLIPHFTLKSQTLKSQTSPLQFRPYGFIRFNSTYDFQNLGRSDLFKPSTIIVPEKNQGSHNFFMGVKQSRMGVEINKLTQIGNVKGVIEIDFFDTSSGIVGKARIRHIYLQWKGLTIGQAWSTFFDIQARPNIINFEGANSSTLNRPPLIRYEWKKENHQVALSLEHPIEQITVSGNASTIDPNIPDFASSYKVTFHEATDFIKVAGLLRQLRFSTDNVGRGVLGWGAMITGKTTLFSKDCIKFQLITGKGIASYIRGVRGLGYDGIFNELTNNLQTLDISGGFFSFQHFWSKRWNSSFVVGTTQIEQNELLSPDALQAADYASVNLFHEPMPTLALGLELLLGRRINVNGAKASAERLQFSATFNF